MIDSGTSRPHRANGETQGIAELAWSMVLAGDFVDHQDDAVSLELRVIVSQGQKLLDARQLKILQVIGVMDVTLCVGFIVTDADFNFVFREHETELD